MSKTSLPANRARAVRVRRRFSAAIETLEFRMMLTVTPNIRTPIVTAVVVNSPADDVNDSFINRATVTLREAINYENANGGGTISFDSSAFATPQTITLANGELDLTNTAHPITITGPSALVTINGGGNSTVFTVNSGVTASITGVTITDGKSAGFGGGIFNSGTLTLTGDTISNNTAAADGGGIDNAGTGSLTLTGDTLTGNSAPAGSGGGIVNSGGAVILTNDTFTNNSSDNGGALYTVGGTVTSTDVTVSGNSAHFGGGIFNGGSALTLTDTLVAANSALDADPDTDGAVDPSSSNNLIGDGTGLTGISNGVNNNQVGTGASPINPKLGSLQNNGGPTMTFALLAGSPAIGAGVAVNGVTTDQRGLARPATPDIGAYQTGGTYTITVNDTADALDNPAGAFPNQLGSSVTLRDAINAANNAQGNTTIVLAKTTYDFTTADNNWYGPNDLPPVYSNITIQGNGATLQRDSACAQTTAEAMRFFYVSGGIPTELPLGTLTLQNLTLTNGLAKGGDSTIGGGGMGAGGAIFNQGNLTLNGVTLTGNTAMGGSSGVHFNIGPGGVFGGGGIGQDGGGGVNFSSGGGFGGNFPAGIYGGAGTAGGGGGFDATAALAVVGGGFGGLGGNLNAQGFGGDGGTSGQGVGSGFGFGGVLNLNDPAGGLGYGGGGGGGGVGGGGGSGDAHGGGDGGFGGGGGSATFSYPAEGNDGGESAGGFGGGGGGPNFSTFGADGGGYGGFGAGHASESGSGGGGGGMGGAVFSMFGSLTVINSTLTANTAQGGGSSTSSDGGPGTGGSGFGGAIFNLDGTASITFSTLVANTVTAGVGSSNGSADGGAIYNLAYGSNYDTGAAVSASSTISDSILAGTIGGVHDLVNQEVDGGHAFGGLVQENTGNTASITANAPNIVVALSNLSGGPNGTASVSLPGIIQTDPKLGPLANNGGPTQTMALLAGSPAIDAGSNAAIPNGITTDQRGSGFNRIANGTVDIGAFEVQAVAATAPIVTTNPSSQTVTAGQTATFTAAASGTPTPTVQWEYSTDGGSTFHTVVGANSTTYSFTATIGQNGYMYRAVFTNSANSAHTTAATLTVAAAAFSIDAGGPSAGSYVADTDFAGGNVYSTTAAIDTSNVANPAPQSVYQTERYGDMTYTIPGLTPNASYNVRLHFAELFFNAAGQRSFNVTINNKLVLSKFDIFAAAGGKDKAIVEAFASNADASGAITIVFTSVKDFAKIDGIELVGTTVTPPPPPSTASQIDAGGGAFGTYSADTEFTGGSTFNVNHAIDTSQVASPAPEQVYQTERYGNFSYTIGSLTPNSSHTVTLSFSENYWASAGQRTFNITINGVQVRTGFDIFTAAGGEYKAIAQTFNVTADSAGKVVITFTTVKDNAKVDAISIDTGSAPAPTPATAINAGGSGVGNFAADEDFVGGNTYSNAVPVDNTTVADPPPQPVFQTERYGNFSYVLPGLNAGASYTLRLDFAELFWNAANQRLFNVLINGTQVLTNFDIYQASGGKFKAVTETFTATADSGGKITLLFNSVKDNAKVDGIEITPVAQT